MFGLMAAATAVACLENGHQDTGGSQKPGVVNTASDGIGAVGMALTLPGGEHISRLDYTLSNAANTYTGHYDVTNTVTVSLVIPNVASGTGYQLTLSATSDDGKTTCAFPSVGTTNTQNITVVNRTTTTVMVNMQCVVNQGLDAGSVLVTATQANCPVWNTIVANPINITLDAGANVNNGGDAGSTAFFPGVTAVPADINDGQQLVLVGGATGPNPGALVFNWTTTGGTLSSALGTLDPNSNDAGSANQTIFTCPPAPAPSADVHRHAPHFGLTAPTPRRVDVSKTTGTVQIKCENPAVCGGLPFASSNGGACLLGGVAAGNDPAGFPYVTTGATDPAVPTDFCCAGACGDGTVGSLSTPFSATGTCAAPKVNNGSGCCVPLLPCTAAGQTNCVKCQGNASGICTPTETALVQHDITKGLATAPGNDPAGTCYSCLLGGACIDDTTFGDSGHECEDSLATFGTSAMCEATISCIFQTACAKTAVAACYCGTAGVATTCQGNPAPGPINGACDRVIAAGLVFPVTDGTDNTAKLENVAYAAGKADQIFQCALANSCAACQN